MVPRYAVLGTSHLRARGFFTWNLSRTWLRSCMSLVSTQPSNLLASKHSLFLACHARTHERMSAMPHAHATSSIPCVHDHSMQGEEPKEGRGGVVREARHRGGVEGLERRKCLPGLEDFEKLEKKNLPIPDADQSAEPAGVSRVYTCIVPTLERRSDGAGFFHAL